MTSRQVTGDVHASRASATLRRMARRPRDERDPTASEMLAQAGLRLEAARRALGLSVEEMASAMGVGRTTLQNWMAGISKQDWLALTRLQLRLGVTIEFILLGLLRSVPFDLAQRLLVACQALGAPVSTGALPPESTIAAAAEVVAEGAPSGLEDVPPPRRTLHERR